MAGNTPKQYPTCTFTLSDNACVGNVIDLLNLAMIDDGIMSFGYIVGDPAPGKTTFTVVFEELSKTRP